MSEQFESKELTPKESLFVDEYIRDFNAARAARAAGYSAKNARAIGYENLTKLHIKEELKIRLRDRGLGPDETKKLIADVATANISNYMKPVKVLRSEKVKKGLQELIEAIRAEIEFEDEYALQANLREKELAAHSKAQESRRRQIIRYKLELARNPDAHRFVQGPEEFVEDVELDLVALAKDKEGGRIKSMKQGKYGLEVDLLPADGALTNLARIHGLFKDNVDVTMNGNIDPESFLKKHNTGDAQ